MNRIMIGLFLSGLLFGSGPCIASCGPILISYIAGTKKNILKGLKVYIFFSLGRISVYIILSLVVFFLGQFALEHLLGVYSKHIFILGGSFIVLLGLAMALGALRLARKPWTFLQQKLLEQDKKSATMLGLLIGFLPCAPLLAILSYVGLISKTWTNSLLYSFSFGMGTFVSPLILLAIFAGLIPQFLLNKKAIYAQTFSFICGVVIMFLGIQLIIKSFR